MAKTSDKPPSPAPGEPGEPGAAANKDMAAVVARARRLMLIAALTTIVAVAAVAGVIGYRVFSGSGSESGRITSGTVFLPKGARVISTTIGGGSVVVTLDINGNSEVRIYDRKTLQQTGRLGFATQQE